MKSTLKEFYEDYWKYRKEIGKIHTGKDSYIPERLKAVISMIGIENDNLNILDIGCGEGTLGMLLRQMSANYHTHGCDISETSIDLARQYYDKTTLFNIDVEEPRDVFGNKKFDIVVCIEVIEHLLDPQAALEKCKYLIKQDGFIITSFPNIAWWKYRLKLLKGHFPEESRFYHHAEHLHDFTMHSFTKLLDQAGLKIIEIGGEFIPPKLVKNLLPGKLANRVFKRYPNLFGYQIVLKTKKL